MERRKLNDGVMMPVLGLGTFRISIEDTEKAVLFALTNGYDAIDTANVYRNEEAVGRAIKAAGRKREDIFITSKIFPTRFKDFDKALEETLDRLGLDYLDLLLLHRPYGKYAYAYSRLVEAQKKGLVRSVGVSNFSNKQIEEIVNLTGVVPALNQIECNPYCLREEERAIWEKKGVLSESWFPFGGGKKELLSDPIIEGIAKAHDRSIPQIILRYLYEQNIFLIPGSKTEAHIKSNASIFDFSLSEEEIKQLKALDKDAFHKDTLGRFTYFTAGKDYYEKKK